MFYVAKCKKTEAVKTRFCPTFDASKIRNGLDGIMGITWEKHGKIISQTLMSAACCLYFVQTEKALLN